MSKERYRLITEYPKDEFFDNKQVVKFDSYEVIRTLNQQAYQIADLEAKLAESEEKINMLEEHKFYADNIVNAYADKCKKHNQDKISFAVEQLEKVLDITENILDDAIKNCSLNESYYDTLLDKIDNQIKQLKEMK